MSFKQYYFIEKRYGLALKAERKIVDFLNTEEAKQFRGESELIYKIPNEVIERLGISEDEIKDLEMSSTGNEKFLATLDNEGLLLYLKNTPKYLRF